ncbi:OLC1v1034366C1 [Oldenlandia corymbosa var. corymbosa]|uniref:OLC1v1034366C1 n=1 Tax=Oldenlandia corymbosa var. corymbosa TaxID=529605 RepID=A0AAV1CR48_OLDCO|nr:OLC1v1034366C1 [Oldenlandia corymbosa var. corymbosa]
MESNAMATGLYSNMGPGMLGLEMSLQPHQLQPPQNSQISHHMQQHPPPPPPTMVGFTLHDGGSEQLHHPQAATAQMAVKQSYPFAAAKPKSQSLTLSDDDEAGLGTENSGGDADGKRKMSPWQRMKWTDNMVRLLIMVVYYIGDEGGPEGNDPSGKKKGAGVLQKKGKWKSVSRAMMERGFYVSPQQCEDKFNDLNKRYKRVNDILGKGTSCKVVENQSLLDTMDHLSAKTKEEVKKLLNSKHLFFREMCAYHNTCGHGGGGGGGAAAGSSGAGGQPSQSPEGSRFAKGANRDEDDDEEDDENDHDEDEDDDDDEDDDHHPMVGAGARGNHDHSHDADDDTPIDERFARKRQRNGGLISPAMQRLSTELASVIQDETKNPTEKRQWIKSRVLQLEEQHVGYQSQAFELEKQRLKWVKYISKKEREMERDKLQNERMRLENERMLLLIRQKEIELLDVYQHQQQFSRRNDPSSVTG